MRFVQDEKMKAYAKDETLLLGNVQRYIESRCEASDRRQDCIHPSELCREDFCPRAVYYRMSGRPTSAAVPFALQSIFDEGSTIHAKWQGWLWDMGDLVGRFSCLRCRSEGIASRWWGTAPTHCPKCRAPRPYLSYDEVPLADPEHLLAGHADLRVGMMLGEIKSVGLGTVRIEAPQLYARHTHKIIDGAERTLVDLAGMWRGIKRPFTPHVRQIMLYLHCTGLDQAVVLYECKWNQQAKEFLVGYSPQIVEPMLDACLDVKYALKTQKPPVCPHGGCPLCQAFEGANYDAEENRGGSSLTPSGGGNSSGGGVRAGGIPDPWAPGARPATPPGPPDRSNGRPTNGAVLGNGALERPYRRVAGTPRGKRKVR